MMNRVEMNEEMMAQVNGGGLIPVVDQNETLRIPERNVWEETWDDVCDAWNWFTKVTTFDRGF